MQLVKRTLMPNGHYCPTQHIVSEVGMTMQYISTTDNYMHIY